MTIARCSASWWTEGAEHERLGLRGHLAETLSLAVPVIFGQIGNMLIGFRVSSALMFSAERET